MKKLLLVVVCLLFVSTSYSAQHRPGDGRPKGGNPAKIAQDCALKCLKEKHIGYFPCMGNCVNGKPLACGNGRIEKNEHCGNCSTDAACAAGEDCLKTGAWRKGIGEISACATCGDGVVSPGEDPVMFPKQACLIDFNGESGCGTKNGKCGFTSDCRCNDCFEKRPWMGCFGNQTCENTGRKFECVNN